MHYDATDLALACVIAACLLIVAYVCVVSWREDRSRDHHATSAVKPRE